MLPVGVGAERRKDLIELPGFLIQPAEFSKILLLIFAAVLVSKRSVFPAQAGTRHGPAAATRSRAAVSPHASVGVMAFEGTRSLRCTRRFW